MVALNESLFDGASAGLRVEFETVEMPIFESPFKFPFQCVSVWRGDECLTSVRLPEAKEA